MSLNKYAQNRGFTLIELLIALSIFAIITTISFTAINHTVRVVNLSKNKIDRLAEIQLAWHIINQDLLHLVSRPIRVGQDNRSAFSLNKNNYIVSFTRGGIPILGLGNVESGLERVSYAIENNTLYRVSWPVLDRTIDAQPIISEILTKVTSAAVIVDANVMSNSISNATNNAKELYIIPASIEFSMELEDMGKISRLYPKVSSVNTESNL